jgi:DNA polymerase-3 subunit gamma/tau
MAAENAPEQRPMARFNSFADIVALAAEKRDIKFKSDLERHVRPISVGEGKIELALEQGADPQLATELSRKLEAWTGRRWIIAVARAGGSATIAQQKKDARDSAFKWAREQADVQAVLKAFPGAEILNVIEPAQAAPTEEQDDEPR